MPRFKLLCTVGATDLLCAEEERTISGQSESSAVKSMSGMLSGSGPYT